MHQNLNISRMQKHNCIADGFNFLNVEVYTENKFTLK